MWLVHQDSLSRSLLCCPVAFFSYYIPSTNTSCVGSRICPAFAGHDIVEGPWTLAIQMPNFKDEENRTRAHWCYDPKEWKDLTYLWLFHIVKGRLPFRIPSLEDEEYGTQYIGIVAQLGPGHDEFVRLGPGGDLPPKESRRSVGRPDLG
ncbi:hypothetical protein K440DRAFT_639188 [Wilcoxina mikolae CBS 423.85]|nr:hypothetical protein K440DRAFT_639188 [Wilcoxina mikolae CBS 423.85]